MFRTALMIGGLLTAAAAPALANNTYSGVVNGCFSDAVLSGNVIATDYSLQHYDNSGSAVYGYNRAYPLDAHTHNM